MYIMHSMQYIYYDIEHVYIYIYIQHRQYVPAHGNNVRCALGAEPPMTTWRQETIDFDGEMMILHGRFL